MMVKLKNFELISFIDHFKILFIEKILLNHFYEIAIGSKMVLHPCEGQTCMEGITNQQKISGGGGLQVN